MDHSDEVKGDKQYGKDQIENKRFVYHLKPKKYKGHQK